MTEVKDDGEQVKKPVLREKKMKKREYKRAINVVSLYAGKLFEAVHGPDYAYRWKVDELKAAVEEHHSAEAVGELMRYVLDEVEAELGAHRTV